MIINKDLIIEDTSTSLKEIEKTVEKTHWKQLATIQTNQEPKIATIPDDAEEILLIGYISGIVGTTVYLPKHLLSLMTKDNQIISGYYQVADSTGSLSYRVNKTTISIMSAYINGGNAAFALSYVYYR